MNGRKLTEIGQSLKACEVAGKVKRSGVMLFRLGK